MPPGQDKDSKRSFTNYCYGQNTLNLRKISLLLIKLGNIVRNKTKSCSTFLHPSLLRRFSFTPNFSTSSHPAGRMGVVMSSSHIVSGAPSSSGRGLPLFQCGVPFPKESRSFKNFSNASCLQGLSFIKCSSMSPFPWGAVLLQWGLFSPQILPWQILLQHRLPLESQPPPDIPLLWRGLLQGLQVDLCTPRCPPGSVGAQPPLSWLHHRISGKSQL